MLPQLSYLREIAGHPAHSGAPVGAILRYLRWNFGRRLISDVSFRVDIIPGVSVLLSNQENYATLAYTCGMYDFEDMCFLLHVIRAGEVFGDFGANAGVYSVLAGSAAAKVLCVEPVPATFEKLRLNIALNAIDACASNSGLGVEEGVLRFTTGRGGLNRVATAMDDASIAVRVTTADSLATATGLFPLVIKLDVEGFELPVLKGARELLAQSVSALIVELNGSGQIYGHTDNQVHQYLANAGFTPWRYEPRGRRLIERTGPNSDGLNTIYIKSSHIEQIRERIQTANLIITRYGRF